MAFGFVSYTLQGVTLTNPTGIEFGADGRLYVSQQNGQIVAMTINQTVVNGNPVYAVSSQETIGLVAGIPNHNDDGTKAPGVAGRLVTGVAMSSTTNASGHEAVVIYVGSSDPRISIGADLNLDTNSGVISKLTQVLDASGAPTGQWDMVHLVRGLPRSEENHTINGLRVIKDENGEDAELIVVTGGNTNNGATSNNFSGTGEYAWANAIVRLDLRALEAADVRIDPEGQAYILDLPTLDDPTRNYDGQGADSDGTVSEVFGGNNGYNQAKITSTVEMAVDGQIVETANPLRVFSPGYRNAYDVIVTKDGLIYTIDNGPNFGWGGAPIAWSPAGQTTSPATTAATAIGGTLAGGAWESLRATSILNDAVSSIGFGDQLHLVGAVGDTYGIYGGHPNPIRASVGVNPETLLDSEIAPFLPNGVTLATATPVQIAAAREAAYQDFLSKLLIFYEQLPNGSWADAGIPLPEDLADVVSGYGWTGPDGGPALINENGFSIESALILPQNDGSLRTFNASTNGMAEWTFTGAFGGEWTGALITVSFDNSIYFMRRSADGTQILETQVIPVPGNFPLSVTAQGDNDPFAGTIWTAQYGPNTIAIWVPSDGSTGFVPADRDGDGVDDQFDRFAGDVQDGTGALLNGDTTFVWNWEPTGAPPPGSPYSAPIAEIGFIGSMADFQTPAHLRVFGGENGAELIRDGLVTSTNWKFGGATGRVDVEVADDGDPRFNNQRETVHVGFQVGQNVSTYEIQVPLRNIFTYAANQERTWDGGERAGFYIGTGDQDNYIFVVHGMVNFGTDAAPDWRPGIEIAVEVDGVYSKTVYEAPELAVPNVPVNALVDLRIVVDVLSGTATPMWRQLPSVNLPEEGFGPNLTVGQTITLSGAVREVLTGGFTVDGKPSGVALGLLATTEPGDDSFASSWDDISVRSTALTQRIEAETFTITQGFIVQQNNNASGQAFLQAGNAGVQSAFTVFDGAAGVYNLTVGYVDENDGVSSFSVLVNGETVDSWLWNSQAGTPFADPASFTSRTIQSIELRPGDTITVTGTPAAAEPLRVDYLELTRVGAIANEDTAPPGVVYVNTQTVVQPGASTFQVVIEYADNVAIDIGSIGIGDITVLGPGGAPLTVLSVNTAPAISAPVLVATYVVAAPGGSWGAEDNGAYTVIVNNGQVFDTSGNPAAGGSLGGFTVAIDPPVDPGGPDPFRVQAEALALVGYFAQNNNSASGGQHISVAGTGTASYVHAAAAGVYNVTLAYFDENDGVSSARVLLNGQQIDAFLFNQLLGSPFANAATLAQRTLTGVQLQAGDVLTIEGTSNADEPARFDYLDFAYTGPLPGTPGDTTPPTVVSSAAAFTPGAATGTVTVVYTDNVALAAASFGVADITVTGPGGPLAVLSATPTQGGDGPQRTVVYTIAAPGGAWGAEDNGAYAVALNAGQVLDTSGNPVPAQPLQGFTVAIDPPVDPGGPDPFRVQAEALALVGYFAQNNNSASGGQHISVAGTGTASYVHAAAAGVYNVTLAYFDENDGVSSARVLLNGQQIDAFLFNQLLGSPFANAATLAQRTLTGVQLQAGDVLTIEGTSNADEPARFDYLDFAYTGPLPGTPGDTTPPTVVSSAAAFTPGAATGTVTVVYTDNVALAAASFGVADITVTGPGGPLAVLSATPTQGGDGPQRTVVYTIAAPGGAWGAEDNGAYAVALNAGQVLDTSGNPVPAQPLQGFTVAIDPPVDPGGPDPFRVQAEALALVGYFAQNNNSASGGQHISVAGTGTASYVHAAAAGVYNVTLAYFDENDGVSSARVLLNGQQIDAFLFNQLLGSPFANAATLAQRTLTGVQLQAGDVLTIEGTSNADEPARFDYLDFAYTGPLPGTPGDTTPPTVVSSAAAFTPGAATGTVTVVYTDNVALAAASFGVADITVTGPGGPLAVLSATPTQGGDGPQRTVVYTIAAPGGAWGAEDNGAYAVALNAGQVLDTSGNPVPAQPLQGFTVAIDPPVGDLPISALLTMTLPNSIRASTFTPNSFTITNTGAVAIEYIEIDLSSVAMSSPRSRIVFDPAGNAGDTVAAPFELNTIVTDTGTQFSVLEALMDGGNYLNDSISRQSMGYEVLTLRLDGFDPGDSFRFRIDVDPTSIRGIPGSQTGDSGSITGSEKTGGVFRAITGDTTASGVIMARGVGTNPTTGEAAADSIAVVGTPGPILVSTNGFTNGDQGVLSTANPVVTLQGAPNSVARLVVLEGDIGGPGVALDDALFEVDTAESIQSYLVQLDANGFGSQIIDIGRQTNSLPTNNPTFIVMASATQVVTGLGRVATGQTSEAIRLRYDPGADEANGFYRASDDYLKIQFEDIGLPDGWVYQNASNGNNPGFQGDGYYYWQSQLGLGVNNDPSIGQFSVNVYLPDEGQWTLRIRTVRDSGNPSDARNDLLFKINEDTRPLMVSQTNEPVGVDGYVKIYGANSTWGYAQRIDGTPFDPVSVFNLSAGFHTLSFAPRSEGLHIDFFELYRGSAAPALTAANSEFVTGGAQPIRYEAESFAIVQGFVVNTNPFASKGALLESSGAGQAIASRVFSGFDGLYTMRIGYFDENDGAAQASIFLNGEQIDSWIWNAQTGSNLVNDQTRASRDITDLFLEAGDVIEIRGLADSDPAGGIEPLRFDYFDFLPQF